MDANAQAEEIYRGNIVGVWVWESEFVCGQGPVASKAQKKEDENKLIFYPDLTIEFYKGKDLIRKSRYSIEKIKSNNGMRASFKLRSSLFKKGYAIISNDKMILSKCALDGYKSKKAELASSN